MVRTAATTTIADKTATATANVDINTTAEMNHVYQPFRPSDYTQGTSREWLVANGLGGYASSTAIGSNTRAYHGLLVAAAEPPGGRRLLLSSLDEELGSTHLGNHQYPGAVYPQGFSYLKEFWEDPLPRMCYQVEEAILEKTISMVRKENTTIISYKIRGFEGILRIVPLVHSRSFHAAADLPPLHQEPFPRGTAILAGAQSQLESQCRLFSDLACYVPQERVYYNFEYEEERRRGLAWKENLFSPGFFELKVSEDVDFAIVASSWRASISNFRSEQDSERKRLNSLKAPIPTLARAADSFLVKRGNSLSLIAGYHWFDDWGRDAMIALPGLLLTTGRFEEARSVLRLFAGAMIDGVLPNDLAARSYNTVDASLWFMQAIGSYYDYTKDIEFIREMWPRLLDVINRYSRSGGDFGLDEDGLIVSGPALTWMDARVDGRPVTPRSGKCCEINALWYCALNRIKMLARAIGLPDDPEIKKVEKQADQLRKSYLRFWNSETGCLYDVIDHEDASVRPNQIIAASVPDLLPLTMRKSILDVVARELLVPFGLRTLSFRDPRYVGRYGGDPLERDSAYHQGTVWPWLLGPYIDALLSVKGRSQESREEGLEALQPFSDLLAGRLNTLPEVFDGDSPHRPGGCISQAWSVGEVLRAKRALED